MATGARPKGDYFGYTTPQAGPYVIHDDLSIDAPNYRPVNSYYPAGYQAPDYTPTPHVDGGNGDPNQDNQINGDNSIAIIYRKVMSQHADEATAIADAWQQIHDSLDALGDSIYGISSDMYSSGGASGGKWSGAAADEYMKRGPGATLKSIDDWIGSAASYATGMRAVAATIDKFQNSTGQVATYDGKPVPGMVQLWQNYERDMNDAAQQVVDQYTKYGSKFTVQQVKDAAKDPTSDQAAEFGPVRSEIVERMMSVTWKYDAMAQALIWEMAQEYQTIARDGGYFQRATIYEGPHDAIQDVQLSPAVFGLGAPPSLPSPPGKPDVPAGAAALSALKRPNAPGVPAAPAPVAGRPPVPNVPAVAVAGVPDMPTSPVAPATPLAAPAAPAALVAPAVPVPAVARTATAPTVPSRAPAVDGSAFAAEAQSRPALARDGVLGRRSVAAPGRAGMGVDESEVPPGGRALISPRKSNGRRPARPATAGYGENPRRDAGRAPASSAPRKRSPGRPHPGMTTGQEVEEAFRADGSPVSPPVLDGKRGPSVPESGETRGQPGPTRPGTTPPVLDSRKKGQQSRTGVRTDSEPAGVSADRPHRARSARGTIVVPGTPVLIEDLAAVDRPSTLPVLDNRTAARRSPAPADFHDIPDALRGSRPFPNSDPGSLRGTPAPIELAARKVKAQRATVDSPEIIDVDELRQFMIEMAPWTVETPGGPVIANRGEAVPRPAPGPALGAS